MLPLVLLFIVCGLAVACILIYYLCAYCAPLVCAVFAAQWAWLTGAGPIGSLVVGALAFATTLVGLQLAVVSFPPALRMAIIGLVTFPALILAYSLSDAILRSITPSHVWRVLFAIAFSTTVAAGATRGLFPFRAAA